MGKPCAHGRDSLHEYCASCMAEMLKAGQQEGLSAAATVEAMRLDYELSKAIERARIDAQIEVLEWCLNREMTRLGTFGGMRPIPEIHKRIDELRNERERLE